MALGFVAERFCLERVRYLLPLSPCVKLAWRVDLHLALIAQLLWRVPLPRPY